MHRLRVLQEDIVEMVFISPAGNGFTHPVHVHGFSYRVVAMDRVSGRCGPGEWSPWTGWVVAVDRVSGRLGPGEWSPWTGWVVAVDRVSGRHGLGEWSPWAG